MYRRSFANIVERGFFGAVIALVYVLVNLEISLGVVVGSLLIGFLLGFSTGWLDRWLFNTRLRRQQFLVVLLVRTIAYVVLVSLILLLTISVYLLIENKQGISALWRSQILQGWISEGSFFFMVLYSLIVLLVLQFGTLISRLLGPNVLINYLLGRYHQPKEEERIFMFMDLRSSTTIAERLGHLKWHNFLNDFFFDIAKPVRRYRGEIYQYVGDEVVISWPKSVGVKDLNCIRCFFGILGRMELKKERYLNRYGYEPVFKSGYHVGTVVIGEIGDYKRDIVFHGDTVNTASRIQAACNHYDRRLLLSKDLLNLLSIEGVYSSEYLGNILLRGKEEEVELYSLDPLKEEIKREKRELKRESQTDEPDG